MDGAFPGIKGIIWISLLSSVFPVPSISVVPPSLVQSCACLLGDMICLLGIMIACLSLA